MTSTERELSAPPTTKAFHFTVDERAARGRAARTETPRTSHASLEPAAGRNPLALLDADNEGRVPELIPIRYGRMLVSPFAFYRGAAAVMAHDLASTPRAGPHVQRCDAAHLANSRALASPAPATVYDPNAF